MKKGTFIVIDGGEGAGKSSVISFLQQQYQGEQIIWTREPGGSPFGKDIRSLILSDGGSKADAHTLFELFWADRCDHLHHIIRPALDKGEHVISDRFDSSTFAYQIAGEQREHLVSLFNEKRERYLAGYTPDLYIFLDIDPIISLERVANRGEQITHFEERHTAFHNRVREGFRSFLADKSHVVIDANRPLEEVQSQVFGYVQELLKKTT